MRRALVMAVVVTSAAARPAAGQTAPAGERYAFLVACQDYDEKELRPLAYPSADITAFRDALLASGYPADHVVTMHDRAERRYIGEGAKIRREFRLLLGGVTAEDTVVVAFAGHGVQFAAEEKAYFCPSDAALADRSTLVALDEVLEALKRCPARQKLLLVDACRNDPRSPLARSLERVRLESATRPPAAEAVPRGTLALFSCDSGQQSYEHPDLGHGVFFHHVVKGWAGAAAEDGVVTLDGLRRYVSRHTHTFVRSRLGALQTPVLRGEARATEAWELARVPAPVSPEVRPPFDWRSDYNAARREAVEHGRVLLLTFVDVGGTESRRLLAGPLRDPTVVGLVRHRYVPLLLRADREAELARALQVRSYPTLILARADGKILDRVEGQPDAPDLLIRLGRATLVDGPDRKAP